MSIRERLSGNEATAYAMKQINPDVVAAFPITPSTDTTVFFFICRQWGSRYRICRSRK